MSATPIEIRIGNFCMLITGLDLDNANPLFAPPSTPAPAAPAPAPIAAAAAPAHLPPAGDPQPVHTAEHSHTDSVLPAIGNSTPDEREDYYEAVERAREHFRRQGVAFAVGMRRLIMSEINSPAPAPASSPSPAPAGEGRVRAARRVRMATAPGGHSRQPRLVKLDCDPTKPYTAKAAAAVIGCHPISLLASLRKNNGRATVKSFGVEFWKGDPAPAHEARSRFAGTSTPINPNVIGGAARIQHADDSGDAA